MTSRNPQLALAAAALVALASNAGPAAAARATDNYEAAFLAVPSAAGARATSLYLSDVYHYAGTPGDLRVALYVRDQMTRFGVPAHLETFETTVYTPKTIELELLTPRPVKFDLNDPIIAADPVHVAGTIEPPFNAGSGNGDVTAALVDAGRGTKADYARLAAAQRDVSGKLVLVRYGAEYRGDLAKRAQDHGAAGVLFFTDTKRNAGPAYPDGPYPSDKAIQRGDVMGNDNRPLQIPTLPISGLNARVLLSAMKDGVTTSNVHLNVVMNATRKTLWNTIGEIVGKDPRESVILGAHRDAWEEGISDDGSGVATLLEVARGLGRVRAMGWRPQRTSIIAAWDAEEIGTQGSASFVAGHRSELMRGGVAYINTDEAASGPTFGISAAAALTTAVMPPLKSVLQIKTPLVGEPSGGSDFDSFIYTVGTPIVDLGYGGPLGTYHSPYDDFRFTALYADPGFIHHKTIAQTIGLLAMRLADGSNPLRLLPYADQMLSGLDALQRSGSSAGLTTNFTPLRQSLSAYRSAAARVDGAGSSASAARVLPAVQRLDLLLYSASGYAAVTFPQINTAIESGSQAALDKATTATDQQLRLITQMLES